MTRNIRLVDFVSIGWVCLVCVCVFCQVIRCFQLWEWCGLVEVCRILGLVNFLRMKIIIRILTQIEVNTSRSVWMTLYLYVYLHSFLQVTDLML
jgi:hypothetical protein